MEIRKVQDGVWETVGALATIGPGQVAFLKEQASNAPLKRARICAHRSADASIHEMIIALDRATYIRPHQHIGKSESFHLIEGDADAVFFDDDGEVTEVVRMAAGHTVYYHLDEARFHMQIVRSKHLVFHEVTRGPYRREETVFAEWSPADDAAAERDAFLADVEARVKEWRRANES